MLTDSSTRSALQLAPRLRQGLEAWAEARYPREACGLLLGRRTADHVLVEGVREARNLATADAHARFDLDPADHLAAEDEARARGLAVVGTWHSHPDRPATPSEADRAGAWDGWTHLIVAVSAGGARDLRAWRLHGRRFVEQEVRP